MMLSPKHVSSIRRAILCLRVPQLEHDRYTEGTLINLIQEGKHSPRKRLMFIHFNFKSHYHSVVWNRTIMSDRNEY